MADVDGDSYCKVGYKIKNVSLQCTKEIGLWGTDCNDDDSKTNPGSSNLSLNCVNDAPIVLSIPNFIVKESQAVIVLIPASDPENDTLTYSINDSRFTQSNINTFQWQTGFYDEGNYIFMATVSDGQFNTTKSFKVEVKDKNQAPILSTPNNNQLPIINVKNLFG